MSKARVYEIAKELNVDSKLIIEKLKEMNVEVKNHMSSVTEEDTAKVKQAFQKPEKRAACKGLGTGLYTTFHAGGNG